MSESLPTGMTREQDEKEEADIRFLEIRVLLGLMMTRKNVGRIIQEYNRRAAEGLERGYGRPWPNRTCNFVCGNRVPKEFAVVTDRILTDAPATKFALPTQRMFYRNSTYDVRNLLHAYMVTQWPDSWPDTCYSTETFLSGLETRNK